MVRISKLGTEPDHTLHGIVKILYHSVVGIWIEENTVWQSRNF